jgi:hypothetical protein
MNHHKQILERQMNYVNMHLRFFLVRYIHLDLTKYKKKKIIEILSNIFQINSSNLIHIFLSINNFQCFMWCPSANITCM